MLLHTTLSITPLIANAHNLTYLLGRPYPQPHTLTFEAQPHTLIFQADPLTFRFILEVSWYFRVRGYMREYKIHFKLNFHTTYT